MAKFPILRARDVLKALQRAGFHVVSQKGSHIRLKRILDGETRIVIVPNHPEIVIGTMQSILRQAGMTREEFLKLLE